MNCPNCGNEIKENQKFCPKCGTKILYIKPVQENTSLTKNNKIMILLFSLVILFSGISIYYVVRNIANEKVTYKLETPIQVLCKIDELQARYFSIIKRNDVLLYGSDNDERQNDFNELNKLFAEVERNIDKNNYYLKKYHEIEKEYVSNSGKTTYDMNIFAYKNYNAVDKLLNEVYQEVKKQIPKDDFKQLKTSELRWLKDVDSYRTVFEQQNFGSMGTLISLSYEVNMRKYRTLLLMLYL